MKYEVKNLNKEYLYLINYNPKFEEELCMMEMKCLFNKIPENKYLFSDIYVNPSRSTFIKEMISIIYKEDSLEKIVKKITQDNLSYDDFKVCYVKLEHGNIPYEDRLKSVYEIGYVVTGFPDIHNPKVLLGITKVDDKWIFGEYIKNDFQWHIHDRKPCSYSNSLSLKVARTLVNIAVKNDLSLKLIDPCCGVGTVVIEALSMGIDVVGYELNNSIAENAQRNLEFFGYDNVITSGNMHDIKEKYDAAILDLPYGLFTPTTRGAQVALINTAYRLADRVILVTFEDLDKYIIDAGFTIVDECSVSKGNFVRYIKVLKA